MKKLFALSLLIVISISGCNSTPAREVSNICNLLDEKVSWYLAAKLSEEKWRVPMHLQLAIIHQESRFASKAKPPRNKIFGIIPGARPTDSFGYTQAKKATWDWYKLKTGNKNAKRDDFADAIDFVGWYANQSSLMSKISKTDAYRQYLAYHEGHGGFNKKSYESKTWLIDIAKKVESKSNNYKTQLAQCRKELDSNRVWTFF
tara:strand:- start:999 stop:1607 length:609 start_codon:yes stop_codon:yes gene_type:complete